VEITLQSRLQKKIGNLLKSQKLRLFRRKKNWKKFKSFVIIAY